MKKAIFSLLTLLATACSPQVYSLYLDVRQPSQSGLDLSHKSMAIVCMESKDSVFDRNSASVMAGVLDQDYFGGQEAVQLYSVPAADSVSLDLMHNLVMDTNADVVFLLSSTLGTPTLEPTIEVKNATCVDSAFVTPVTVPIKTSLKVYDSLSEDKIHSFRGKTTLYPKVFNNGLASANAVEAMLPYSMGSEATKVGSRIATRFVSDWKTESFSFYYFDNFQAETWDKALRYVYANEFSKAIDIWSEFVKGSRPITRAAAAYNIAMSFYLMEDYKMATRWLDLADSIENLTLSPGLRKRLVSKR